MRFWPPKQLISFILGFLTAYIMITYLWVCKGGCQLEGNGSNSGKSIELKLLSERTVNITSSQTELASLPQRPITLNIKSSKEHVIEVENKLKQSEYKLTRSYPFSEENEFVDIYSLENPPQEDNPQFWEKAKHYNVDDYGKVMTISAQKMKFSIKNFFSKCDQIRSFMQIWSHLLKKPLIENFLCSDILLRRAYNLAKHL